MHIFTKPSGMTEGEESGESSRKIWCFAHPLPMPLIVCLESLLSWLSVHRYFLHLHVAFCTWICSDITHITVGQLIGDGCLYISLKTSQLLNYGGCC